MTNIDAIRATRESREAELAKFRAYPGWRVTLEPIYAWGEYEYILPALDVEPAIQLLNGVQRIELLNVTGMDVARFARWTNDNMAGEQPWFSEEQNLAKRRCAVVVWPDEGHISVLMNDGSTAWVRTAVLPVRVVPGTVADVRAIQDDLAEEAAL